VNVGNVVNVGRVIVNVGNVVNVGRVIVSVGNVSVGDGTLV